MIISDKEKTIKILKKLTEEPELRRLTITPEGNLFMEGNRKYIWQNYLLFSPRGSFWSISDEHYPSTIEGQEAIPIALLTEKKLFINLPFDSYCYISPKNPPQEEDFFLWNCQEKRTPKLLIKAVKLASWATSGMAGM